MSINWVMLAPAASPPFTPLPHEQTLFTSSPRISLSISSAQTTGSKPPPPLPLAASSGRLYLTNRRIIYLPERSGSGGSGSAAALQSFAAPLLALRDSHVTAPWFGPNVWTAALQPTPGGGLPTTTPGLLEVRLTFKEGGAFDFHSAYERVRERLQQAVEVARVDDAGPAAAARVAAGVDVAGVHLDQLPAYQESSDGPLMAPIAPVLATSTELDGTGAGSGAADARPTGGVQHDGPPPAYE